MIKVNIKTNGETSSSGTFETQEKANEWVQKGIQDNYWGKPERPELDSDGVETGNILPAEYSVEVVDITAANEQERINRESLNYLESTDWYVVRKAETGVDIPAEILTARAQARLNIVR